MTRGPARPAGRAEAGFGSWRYAPGEGRLTCDAGLLPTLGLPSGVERVPPDVLHACFHPDDRERVRAWCAGLDDGPPAPIEARVAGGTRIVRLHGRREGDRYAGDFEDVTALRCAEAARDALAARLRASERYKDEFLSVLGHEMRNPMAAVMGLASLLEAELGGPLTPDQARWVAEIDRHAGRMLRQVEAMLDQARMLTGHFEVAPRAVDLAAAIADAVARAACPAGVRVVAEAAGPIALEADPDRLGQVLDHLIENAVRHSPGGGIVRVRARTAGGWAETEVMDQGPGVDPGEAALLFGRFVQLEEGLVRGTPGLGLGLSLCKAIVDAHAGAIGMTSMPGAGATFWFRLPLHGRRSPPGEDGRP